MANPIVISLKNTIKKIYTATLILKFPPSAHKFFSYTAVFILISLLIKNGIEKNKKNSFSVNQPHSLPPLSFPFNMLGRMLLKGKRREN